MNLKKLKKWKVCHKETRKPNSGQYKFSRMIVASTEAFRIRFMKDFKSWIQSFKNHWSKVGRPTFDPVVFQNLNSAFGNVHKFDSKRLCACNYHSWKFVLTRIWLSCFLMTNFSLFHYFQIHSILRMSRSTIFLEKIKFGQKWAGPLENVTEFLNMEKKSFVENISFFTFYELLSFFNGKYGYFTTIDRQISEEKLISQFL